jgi:seryl-tRNA synthetase
MQPKYSVHVSVQAKEDATELKNQSIAIKAQIIEAETAEQTVATERDQTIKVIGNLVHDSVPVHDDEVCTNSFHIFTKSMQVGEAPTLADHVTPS